MLNPESIVTAFVNALLTIPDLTVALGPDPTPPLRPRISGFFYEAGEELPLAKVLYEIPTPGILVVWEGVIGGNFDGTSIWKHKLEVYLRSGNVAGHPQPTGIGYLWYLLCDQPVDIPGYSNTLNIRNTQILPGLLICDTPSLSRRQDQDGLDFFCGNFTLPEIGDNQ